MRKLSIALMVLFGLAVSACDDVGVDPNRQSAPSDAPAQGAPRPVSPTQNQ
ncbi:MAG: hypothetical protein J0H82_32810 [Alphaproteobacteria bacterium]|jgi:hypothetical protein|nr:hypothetical protein [Alphaproteobacteria bacterium]